MKTLTFKGEVTLTRNAQTGNFELWVHMDKRTVQVRFSPAEATHLANAILLDETLTDRLRVREFVPTGG